MGGESETRHIVVVDDHHRFAVHVWQYLASGLAFGIGDLKKSTVKRLFYCLENDQISRAVATPSFRDRVWWIDAERGDTIIPSLKQALEKAEGGTCQVLLDVRGPRNHEARASYNLDRLIQFLSDLDFDWQPESARRLILVSAYSKASYRFESRLLRVYEKAPSTLETLWRPPPPLRESVATQHILVTGAGFELPSSIVGKALGIPTTGELIRKALKVAVDPSKSEDRDLSEEGETFSPLPFPDYWERVLRSQNQERSSAPHVDPSLLKRAASDGALDAYWDEFLQLELIARMIHIEKEDPSRHRAQIKQLAGRWELELRDAFRRVLLDYDWGYLNQALDAAELPWGAWLTTNYTRFADRTIALQPKRSPTRPWRIVSTSNEAAHLQREILHGTGQPGEGSRDRILFKLHGDIAHLTTMAIAGHDKEIFTPLSMPIDSLHEIYGVAERFLDRICRHNGCKDGAPSVMWHIVGHGLQDRQLTEILRRISESSPERHRFAVIDPKAAESVAERLRKLIGGDVRSPIVTWPFTAEEYMACLRWRPELFSQETPDLNEWTTALPVNEAKGQRKEEDARREQQRDEEESDSCRA